MADRPTAATGGGAGDGPPEALRVRERAARRTAEAARRRLAFLGEAALTLGASLDSEATLLAIGRLAVPALADWCVVEVEAQAHRPRRVAVFHGDPACSDAARELARRVTQDPAQWSVAGRVRRSGRAELYPVVSPDLLLRLAHDAEGLRLLQRLGLESVAVVPLRARDWVLGVLTLASGGAGERRVTPADMDAVEDFAVRAAAALDNAHLYEAGVEALRARDRAVEALLVVARQQAAVAELGRRALAGDGAPLLMEEACSLVAQALPAEACAVFERVPDGRAARLVAGVGWPEGSQGRVLGAEAGPLLSGLAEPVADLRADPRLRDEALLREQELVSALVVAMPGRPEPRGTLAAFTRSPRRFEQRDLHFLQGAANVLSAAAEREASQAALAAREERFRALIEKSSDGIALLDRRGRLVYVGPSTQAVLGYDAEELVRGEALALVHPEDAPALRRSLEEIATRPRQSTRLEHRVRHRDGSWRWVETVLTNLLEEPNVGALVANYRDITDRRRAEEQVRYRAHHDGLTDLPNRMLFGDRLALALAHAHRGGAGFAVLFIDLDQLKQVNDTLGHAVGDKLLRAVADRLKASVRESDSVARVGGDEFTVVLDDVTRGEDAARTAHKILAAIGRPFELDGRVLQVTASIGIAIHPQDGVDVDTLLKNADHALYRAKEAGRNTYQLCTPELNRAAYERLRLERDLREALERGELRLHYQPELDAASGRILGAEALLRWHHPELGLLPAAVFVPVAESTRLILPIGEWVLDTMCRQVRAWQGGGLNGTRVSVNLSAVQLQQRHLVRMIERVVGDTGVDPRSLEFEITETAAMRDTESAKRLMLELRGLGAELSIDDFGTGYSSLAALKRFPIHALKIDQAFISDVAVSNDDAMLVRAIITMAHALRLRVVAEGVETADQLAFLQREKCDVVQGFFLGRPVPPEAIARWN